MARNVGYQIPSLSLQSAATLLRGFRRLRLTYPRVRGLTRGFMPASLRDSSAGRVTGISMCTPSPLQKRLAVHTELCNLVHVQASLSSNSRKIFFASNNNEFFDY